jgi:predicted nucleic acid-binding protein
MTVERDLAFVDTNVLVYAFEKSSSPKKRVAQRLINELMEEDRLRVSTQVLRHNSVTGYETPAVWGLRSLSPN